MATTKELRELIRAVSAVILEAIDDIRDDSKFSTWEGIKALHLIPTILDGIKGVSKISEEARDIQPDEWAQIVAEIKESSLKSGMTNRNADVVERSLTLAYMIICEMSAIINLPPTALKVDV